MEAAYKRVIQQIFHQFSSSLSALYRSSLTTNISEFIMCVYISAAKKKRQCEPTSKQAANDEGQRDRTRMRKKIEILTLNEEEEDLVLLTWRPLFVASSSSFVASSKFTILKTVVNVCVGVEYSLGVNIHIVARRFVRRSLKLNGVRSFVQFTKRPTVIITQ